MKKYIIILHQWALAHPVITRLLHATWQTAAAYAIANASGVHNAHDAKLLLTAALAAGFSTAKSQAWPFIVSWSASTQPHITSPGTTITPQP